jgi:hypothetical protein
MLMGLSRFLVVTLDVVFAYLTFIFLTMNDGIEDTQWPSYVWASVDMLKYVELPPDDDFYR